MRIDEFERVDASDNPGALVAHTDSVRSLDAIRDAKRWTYGRLLEADPVARLLDVGCGTGEDLTALQAAIDDGGVVGVDSSAAMLDQAVARTEGGLLLVRAEGAALPFADGAFDGARIDRVLLHVSEPAAVVGELARVVRPGARVVALEPDFETAVIGVAGSDVDAIQQRLKPLQTERLVRNPRVGHALTALLNDAALVDIAVRGWVSILSDYDLARDGLGLERIATEAVGTVIDEGECERWLGALHRAADDGSFFTAMTFFAACGTKAGG